MQRTSRGGIGLLAAALALLVLPGQSLAAANATGIDMTVQSAKLSLSGTITKHGGGMVQGATVQLIDVNNQGFFDYTFTDASGKYGFYDLNDSQYVVAVSAHAVAPTYAPGFYKKTDPDHFTTVQSAATEVGYHGTAVGNINVAVRTGRSISGKIRRATGGTPLKGIKVSSGSYTATTDASGNYSLTGLPNGTYRLYADARTTNINVISGCYRAAAPHGFDTNCGNATDITVNNANVAGKNIDMPDGHTIKGSVKDAQGHNLCATVTPYKSDFAAVAAPKAACGAFTLTGLPSGDYTVLLSPSAPSHFVAGSFANNAHHFVEVGTAGATIHIGAGNPNLGTIQPAPGHTVSGSIRDAANNGVKNVSVVLRGSTGIDYSTFTDAQGVFTFPAVGSGTHTIQESTSSSGKNLRSGYYKSGAPGNWTASDSQMTTLSGNANHTGIVIKPASGFTISGKVTNASHVGIQSFIGSSGPTYEYVLSDAQGNYKLTGLAPGSYQVSVSGGSNGARHYRSGYYSKTAPGHFSTSYTDASTIHVGP